MRTRQRGYTLVELMITVAIVGVLSMLAVVGYRKIISTSKLTEANTILGDIRKREFALKSELGKYVTASNALATDAPANLGSAYPHCSAGKTPSNIKVAWGGTCSSEPANGWAKLAVEPDGPVFYGYTVVSGSGTPPSVSVNGANIVWPTTGGDYFVATAVGDVDGNGVYGMVVANSFDNEMRVDKEGE